MYLQHIGTFGTLKNLRYSFYICNHKGQISSGHFASDHILKFWLRKGVALQQVIDIQIKELKMRAA